MCCSGGQDLVTFPFGHEGFESSSLTSGLAAELIHGERLVKKISPAIF